MDDINKLELIEKYLEGQLKGKYLEEIEERIQKDASFSKDVEWQRQTMQQLADPGMRLFQERMQVYRKEKKTISVPAETGGKVVQMQPRHRWMAVAASVLLLAIAGWWVMQQGQPDVNVLYAEFESVHPTTALGNIKTELDNASRNDMVASWKPALVKAMQGYPNNVTSLETHTAEYPEDKLARFYLAQAYLQNNNFKKAEDLMLELKNNPPDTEKAAVDWYLALTHLKQGKIGKAKKLLNELAVGTSLFNEQASTLIKRLEK